MCAIAPSRGREELRGVALAATLGSCQLFRGLPEWDLVEIAKSVRLRTLDKNEYLFREGEPAVGFYVVQQGAINVHRVNAAGKEQVIHVFRPDESLAEAALVSPSGYPANARAVEASTVLVVPKTEFLGLVSRRPDLAMRMLASMSQHLRILVGLVDDLKLKDVEGRLASWLVRRCPQPPGRSQAEVRLGVSKRVLAAEIGTSAETLSRTLSSFRERGLIAGRGSILNIPDPSELDALARGEDRRELAGSTGLCS